MANQITKKNLPRQVKGGAPIMLSREVANTVADTIDALRNLQIQVPQTDGTGVQNMKQADIKMTPAGITATLPALPNAQSSGNGASTVPYSGSGAPSATTLAAGITYQSTQPPSLYVDTTGLALYVCTTTGTNSTSAWSQISGGSGGGTFADFYDTTGGTAYSSRAVVQVLTTSTVGGVTIQPGTYILRNGLSTPTSPTGNQVPQYPYPTSGTIYWICIAFGPTQVGTCGTGGVSVYVNATGTF